MIYRRAVARLRALIKELRWHRASVASFVFIVGIFRCRVQRAIDRIDFDARARR